MDSSTELSRKNKKSSKKYKRHSHSRSPQNKYISHRRSSKNYTDESYNQEDVITRERSRSQEGGKGKERRHKRHRKHRKHRRETSSREEVSESSKRREVITVENSDSDSSDCIEVPVDIPPAPVISKRSETSRNNELVAPPPPIVSKHGSINRNNDDFEDSRLLVTSSSSSRHYDSEDSKNRERDRDTVKQREREREREREKEYREREREREKRERNFFEKERAERERQRENHERHHRSHHSDEQQEKKRRFDHSPSPIPENGTGDSLSIEETNKLRLKLGLKPLEVNSGPTLTKENAHSSKRVPADKNLASYKDEWGEFLHKPADNISDKKEIEKIREKLKEKKEKRSLEDHLKRIRTLGESDDEVDDLSQWINRTKKITDEKKEAEKRAKALEEMDAEFGVDQLMEKENRDLKRKAYNDKHLRGLRVDHDVNDFAEGKTVILTLKDKGVLDEDDDGDTLVNVNMVDDERYRKNVENKKQNPLSYGYDVYEEMYDEFGDPIDRGILQKYDQEIEGGMRKKNAFTIGENLAEERDRKRKLLEIKTKLAGKRLETLADAKIQLASDTFSEVEIAKFKKPRKKVKKLRQKLKAEDLLPLSNEPMEQHLGNRRRRFDDTNDTNSIEYKEENLKIEADDEEDLQRVLSKALKLKQAETIIKLSISEEIKSEIKTEVDATNGNENGPGKDGNITLNATAEFCRTLGDIPTYGMAGNRDEDSNDMMSFETSETADDRKYEEPEASTGTWNSVNPEDVIRPMEDDVTQDIEEVAILDEEPDVGAGVGNALRLALSKGYLEKEDSNRPSNTKMAHLQAKNYSIEDKSAGDDDKFGRRDRFHAGPIMDFRDKETFKPNVKLEYIDDNGRILNLKEAFRYLSHKFHGKGPGKNKIEKRLKKMQQDGLMKTMSSTDTPLGTLTMLQQKQRETKTPFVILSGGKQAASVSGGTTISKYK